MNDGFIRLIEPFENNPEINNRLHTGGSHLRWFLVANGGSCPVVLRGSGFAGFELFLTWSAFRADRLRVAVDGAETNQ